MPKVLIGEGAKEVGRKQLKNDHPETSGYLQRDPNLRKTGTGREICQVL